VLELIYSAPDDGGEEEFTEYSAQDWKKELEKRIKRSRYKEVIEPHFNSNVIDDGMDRRQFHVLRNARDQLQQLMAVQG